VSREVPWLPCRSTEWVRRLGACCRCVSLHHGLGLWPAAYKDVARCFVHLPAAPLEHRHPRHAQVCRRARSRPRTNPCGVALRAILDRFCARRLRRSAVGARESLRRGRTREMPAERTRTIGRARTDGAARRAKAMSAEKIDRSRGAPPLTKIAPYKGPCEQQPQRVFDSPLQIVRFC
jgi:hypothetical protein